MKHYTYIGLVGIALVFSLIYMFQNTLSTVEGVEWTPSPYESVDEHIGLVKPIIEENESRIETNKKFIESSKILIASLEKEIQELSTQNTTMQSSIDVTYKTLNGGAIVEDVTEIVAPPVEASQSRYISGGKVIPSGITGNTKSKRFQNFVRYFARGFNESVFVQARNRYGVKEEVLACIARADSDMGNANKSSNNIMNYGNNDHGQTRGYDNVLGSVMAAAHGLSEGKYLSRNKWIGHLSQGGRSHIGVEGCAEKGQYCYATSPINWRRNVNNCLTFIEGERKNWDTMFFKNNNK